jgi:hypothetical protein
MSSLVIPNPRIELRCFNAHVLGETDSRTETTSASLRRRPINNQPTLQTIRRHRPGWKSKGPTRQEIPHSSY